MAELDEEYSVEKVKQVPKSQRFRNHGRCDYHKVNGDYPTTWARRVMKKYVDKPFEEAFAYFCTLVPDYQQKWFKSEFDLSRGWWTPTDKYTLDDEGIIRVVPKEKKEGPVIFRSYDYQDGYREKRGTRIITRRDWYAMDNVKLHPDRYDHIIISGYAKEFESDKDREYIRLMKENAKLAKLDKKNKRKEQKDVAYSFLSKEEVQRKSEIATDLIKVQKHGFDEESFKGIEYHGQKRKLKTK